MTARRVAAVLMVATTVAAGCGDDGPSDDEAAVCGALQEVVDDLAANRSQEAIDTMDVMYEAVSRTSNRDLAAAGEAWFASLFTDVDRFQLTVEQARTLGQQYMADAGTSLGRVIDECAAAGAPIERLPTS